MCLDLSENKIDSYWFIFQICCCCCQIEGTFGHSEVGSPAILQFKSVITLHNPMPALVNSLNSCLIVELQSFPKRYIFATGNFHKSKFSYTRKVSVLH